MSAPLFFSASIFSSAIAVETSGIFTAKIPPNPQHSSSFSQSRRSSPSTFESRSRGSSRPRARAAGGNRSGRQPSLRMARPGPLRPSR